MSVRDAAAAAVLNERLIEEGIFDPYLLKATFLAGSPASGKTFVNRTMFAGTGVKVVNSDAAFEAAMKKAGISFKDVMSDKAQALRPKAKAVTAGAKAGYVEGRLGLVIDGTAKDPVKILRQKQELENLGYDTAMVFVNTSLDVALERNQKRARTVSPQLIQRDWVMAQNALRKYRSAFGKNFVEVKNDEVVSDKQIIADLQPKLWRAALKFLNKPVKNLVGRAWVQAQVAMFKGAMPRIGAKL